MASPKAVKASEVRQALEDIPRISLPAEITPAILDSWIERMTARVLHLRGATSLPEADTVDRNLIDGAVIDLVVVRAKRYMNPGREDIIRLLNEEQKIIEKGLEAVKETNPKRTHQSSGVSGGVV